MCHLVGPRGDFKNQDMAHKNPERSVLGEIRIHGNIGSLFLTALPTSLLSVWPLWVSELAITDLRFRSYVSIKKSFQNYNTLDFRCV